MTNEDCNDVTVHWTYDTYGVANGTAKAVTEDRRQENLVLLTAITDYAFSHSSAEKDAMDVVRANGGEVLGSVPPVPRLGLFLFLLKAQSPARSSVWPTPATPSTRSKQAAEFGVTPKQSLAGLLMFITDVHSLGLKVTQNMYLTEGFYWDLNDETRAWSKRFFDLKKMPTMVQAGQYSSVYHYLQGGQGAGTDDTTPR